MASRSIIIVCFAEARCPRGWITAGSGNTATCYQLFSGLRKNFNAAHAYCRTQGGYIARDTTAAIHNKIKRYIVNAAKSSTHPNSFWLGLTGGIGGTVDSGSALRSAGITLLRDRAPPPTPWPNGGPESPR
ncbi:hypothetical protein PoB_002126100 [Plakobranchus ocellatus]|uniref:C-type lectin domain-containing protein n=1 Tax=Plakobranchus ocellatus TaxID=259542 RepID=A0AAV3ZFT1_9GAST|nr:hypothetical protein PoB_002126100 [Plakobranchus ocellatus]